MGVVFGYARAFALQSTSVETAAKLNTQWSRYYVGGRLRIRTGSEASPIVGLVAAYGDEAFTFDAPQNAPPLPSVDYKLVRASADVRVPFGRAAALAGAGYLVVLSPVTWTPASRESRSEASRRSSAERSRSWRGWRRASPRATGASSSR